MALLRTDNSVEILRKIDTGNLGPERSGDWSDLQGSVGQSRTIS
jgi:hypothetical protein